MTQRASTTDFGTTRDGLRQLRRHWAADDPRAALLLVHGIGEHSGRYEHVGEAFAESGIDTLAADGRGFGRTAGRPGHVDSFDEYVDDVADLLSERRTLGVPVILMGHSLGGLIVTTYLVGDHPQPDLAVLSAPALAAEIPRWQRLAVPVLSRIAPRLHVKSEFDGSVLSRDPAVQDAYDNDPLRVDGSTTALGRHVIDAMKSTSSRLHRLRVPTYVLHGADDELVPPSASEPIGRLTDVTRRVWPGLRHECLNEPERDEVIAAIIEWVDAHLAELHG
ncbi:MAG: alpha/beta hydrolase [Ilumatobacter sp.]|nr:alpha/beta hydrolase [Ilumatobacter sp.]